MSTKIAYIISEETKQVIAMAKRTFILQGNYGQGWEDLTAELSRREINVRLREYRENEGGTYRVVSRA